MSTVRFAAFAVRSLDWKKTILTCAIAAVEKNRKRMKIMSEAKTIDEIEMLARLFAAARDELVERANILRDEQEAIKRRRLQGIKNSLDRVLAAREELHAAIKANPKLFDKPKTRILHGVRVGWMKQRGKLTIANEDACIAALKKLFGDDADAYIKKTEKPIVDALKNIPVKDLAKIGATLTADTDAVMIKFVDDAIDKLIDALTGDVELEAEAQRA
jgi:hypothetical protein